MNPILEAAVELQVFLAKHDWQFCFIGGVAVLRWGQPRTTQDVDVSLFVEFGNEKARIDQILKKFNPRIDGAADFAIESKVVLVESSQGIAFDIAIAQFEFEKAIIDRATTFEYQTGVNLLTISAEDLIVLKAFAGREQDWNDISGIVDSNSVLDFDFILEQLKQLVDLQPENPALERLATYLR